MKTLMYITLLGCLLAGCASTGQAGLEQNSTAKTAPPTIARAVTDTPAKTISPALPAATKPAAAAPTRGVVLSAYNSTQKGYTLRPVDPATGQAIPGLTPVLVSHGKEYDPQLAYSPSGSRLAAIETRGDSCEAFAGGVSCYPKAIAVRIVDLPSWQVISATLPADGWAGAVSFSPTADRLAISYNHSKGSSALVLDTSSGETLTDLALGFRPEGIAFYGDGSRLLAYGALPAKEPGVTPPGPLRLEAFSIPSGEKVWGRELKEVINGSWCLENCDDTHGMQLYAIWTPAFVLSPDGTTLYILHADQDKMTRLSLVDGSSEDVEIHEAQSWIERLLASTAGVALAKGGAKGTTRLAAISPDGQRLYVLSSVMDAVLSKDGYWEPADAVTELQAIDPHSGQILASVPASGYGVGLTADGKYLFSSGWTEASLETQIWSADGLERVPSLKGWELVYSPDLDGNMVLLGSRSASTTTELALVDPENFQVIGSWKYKGPAGWIPTR